MWCEQFFYFLFSLGHEFDASAAIPIFSQDWAQIYWDKVTLWTISHPISHKWMEAVADSFDVSMKFTNQRLTGEISFCLKKKKTTGEKDTFL